MEEKGFKVVGTGEGVNTSASSNNLPGVVSVWSKIRAFLFQEIDLYQKIDLNKEIKLELTPKQEKVFKEVRDFWCQEITGQKIKDFLFQEIKITR